MEINQNNISTIVSMIVPFIAYLIAKFFCCDVDEAMLAMFLTGVIELIVLIWSARNPNTMDVFGNGKSRPVLTEQDLVLNDEYTGDDDGC